MLDLQSLGEDANTVIGHIAVWAYAGDLQDMVERVMESSGWEIA
jgi:hypothetical protein